MSSTTNPNDIPFKIRKQLDACVSRAVSSLQHENTATAESPATAFQRLLKVYQSLKPLLGFLTTFQFVPPPVRTGIGLLAQTLEAVAVAGPELTAQFKAGKDLEAEA